MTKAKGMFLTAVLAGMAGALIYIISAMNIRFYDVFTRIVDVPGYWFLILVTYNFITKEQRRH